jgi:hypothetical protein
LYPYIISFTQEILTGCVQKYNLAIVHMAPGKRARTGSRKSQSPNQGIGERSKRSEKGGYDRLGETRQAVGVILASWALHELIAQRALEDSHA